MYDEDILTSFLVSKWKEWYLFSNNIKYPYSIYVFDYKIPIVNFLNAHTISISIDITAPN
jgi:hypothetical protein